MMTFDKKSNSFKKVNLLETIKNNKVFGVMNVGIRPTFADTKSVIIEVHLIEFNREIYGEEIRVSLLKRLRDEKKFESKEELIYQIERDKKNDNSKTFRSRNKTWRSVKQDPNSLSFFI